MDDSSSTIRSPAHAQWVAVVAVFGAVWGAAEVSLGALLRSAAVPMHGMLMAGIGIVIMLVARRTLSAGGQPSTRGNGRSPSLASRSVPQRGTPRVKGQHGRGAALAVGVVAAAMLPLSVSRGILPAMIGIMAEAACLEIVLYAGHPRRWRFAFAGLFAGLVPPVQMMLWLTAQYGPAALSTFREILLVKQGGAKLGLASQTAGTLVALALTFGATYGLVCGTLAWSIAKQILTRLGRAVE
jgi:hypothetical protein